MWNTRRFQNWSFFDVFLLYFLSAHGQKKQGRRMRRWTLNPLFTTPNLWVFKHLTLLPTLTSHKENFVQLLNLLCVRTSFIVYCPKLTSTICCTFRFCSLIVEQTLFFRSQNISEQRRQKMLTKLFDLFVLFYEWIDDFLWFVLWNIFRS